MIGKLLSSLRGEKQKTKNPIAIRARFDAASARGENFKHFSAADNLSADAAANPEVRKRLRERSRYETSNNSYAFGILETLADYTVGSGPRLQLLTENNEINSQIEKDFALWAESVNLAEKLRIARITRCRDGEIFIILGNNPKKIESPVKLDLGLIEADCVTSDDFKNNVIDGIVFDRYGNPVEYRVLKNHPGSDKYNVNPLEYYTVKAEYMLHYFFPFRPGAHRGIPETTSALPLFAQTRRYTLAVLSAAEAAADFSAVIYTDNPPDGESADLEPLDAIQLEKNMAVTLPGGWKLGQMDAKQPCSTFTEFQSQLLHEIARCLKMPFCLVYGDFGGANYASGRMDFQTFYKSVQVEQKNIVQKILNPLFRVWLREYCLAKNLNLDINIPHSWFWDGTEHVDPSKEANATDIRLKNGTTTYAQEFAKQGKDWEKEFLQIQKEKLRMQELGISIADINQKLNKGGYEQDA